MKGIASRSIGERAAEQPVAAGDSAVTPATFRQLALALPGSREVAHVGHLHFLVGGRIFATLGYPDDGWAVVKLLPEQQEAFISAAPTSLQSRGVGVETERRASAFAWRGLGLYG